jgi:pyruvate dehydrogenase E1 component beta subunit
VGAQDAYRVPGPNGPAESCKQESAILRIYGPTSGLTVIAPSTPADAYGLLKSAIRDDDPGVLESEKAYVWTGEYIDDESLVPSRRAIFRRPGKDVTIISFSNP